MVNARGLLPTALIFAVLAASPTVAVLDVSAEDAVYEDESRELALEVVDVLNAKGFVARRIDESELPKKGCKVGPCLEQVAKGFDVLVTLDVVEVSKGKLGAATTALAGRTGMPLAGGRYTVEKKTKRPPPELEKFAQKLMDAFAPKAAPAKKAAPDAGG